MAKNPSWQNSKGIHLKEFISLEYKVILLLEWHCSLESLLFVYYKEKLLFVHRDFIFLKKTGHVGGIEGNCHLKAKLFSSTYIPKFRAQLKVKGLERKPLKLSRGLTSPSQASPSSQLLGLKMYKALKRYFDSVRP